MSEKPSQKWVSIDAGLLVLRIGIGLMFLVHGYPKLAGGPEKWAGVGRAMETLGIGFAPAMWGFFAALSEFLGGLCLIGGLAVRYAASLMLFTMFVASTKHLAAGDGLLGASHAIEAGIVFLSLVVMGGGRHSLDARLSERSRGAKK